MQKVSLSLASFYILILALYKGYVTDRQHWVIISIILLTVPLLTYYSLYKQLFYANKEARNYLISIFISIVIMIFSIFLLEHNKTNDFIMITYAAISVVFLIYLRGIKIYEQNKELIDKHINNMG